MIIIFFFQQTNHVGIINVSMRLKDVVEKWAEFVRRLAIHRYGRAPDIRLSGHIGSCFPYITLPLGMGGISFIIIILFLQIIDFTILRVQITFCPRFWRMLFEQPLNLIRMRQRLPYPRYMWQLPIMKSISYWGSHLSIQHHNYHFTFRIEFLFFFFVGFIVRISDRGGGIPHNVCHKVMNYNFTTSEDSTEQRLSNDPLVNMIDASQSGTCSGTTGPMHGFGFGLPTSKAYAEYLGGGLTIQSLQGLGTDVYLRLKHIDSKHDAFRI